MRLSTTLPFLALLIACGGTPTSAPVTAPAPAQSMPTPTPSSAPSGKACIEHTDCSDATPICDSVAHVCVACNGDWNTNAPHACLIGAQKCEADGRCVQCAKASDCAPQGLACVDSQCGACSSNAECDTGRCLDGACAPTSAVRLVDNTDPSCGDSAHADGITVPYCNPQDGIPATGQVVLKLAASTTAYESVDVFLASSGSLDVTIVGPGPSMARLGSGNGDAVAVDTFQPHGSVTLVLRGVDIAPANHTQGYGVRCASSSATLDIEDSIIENVTGGGIDSESCATSLERTIVRNNIGVGIVAYGGSLDLTSSLVVDNTGSGVHATDVNGTFSHVTVTGNVVTTADAAGVDCDTGASIEIADSIVAFNGTPKIGGIDVDGPHNLDPRCFLAHVATGVRGDSGDACSPVFVDPPHGDYHLDTASGLAANRACAIDHGDASDYTDLDGNGMKGAASDLGAFETK